MNIKGLHPSPVSAIDSKPRVEGRARTTNTGDRDANGRRDQPEGEQKRKLNDQEFDDALKTLGEMPGLKANGLRLEVHVEDEVRIVQIVAPTGQIVRRFTEAQLWAVTRDKDRQTGTILDKAM